MSSIFLASPASPRRAGRWALFVALVASAPVLAKPFPADSIEPLQKALRIPIRDPRNVAELDARKARLEKLAKAVTGLADLRRAAALQNWRDQDRDAAISSVDAAVRAEIQDRLASGLRAALKKGTAEERLTAVTFIGQMGSSMRVAGDDNPGGFARTFGKDLATILQEMGQDAATREAAARALGLINPDPTVAVPVLEHALTKGEVGLRRAAAEGLAALTAAFVSPSRVDSGSTEAGVKESVALCQSAVAAAGKGLTDADVPVRRQCLEAMRMAAQVLFEVLPDPRHRPEDAPLNKNELAELRTEVAEKLQVLLPLAEALNKELASLAPVLNGGDVTLAQSAAQAVEAIGEARARWQNYAGSVPEAIRGQLVIDPFVKGMPAVVPGLAKLLSQEPVRARLAAIYALETLGPEAGKAIPELVVALDDRDAFVRWGAARALDNLAPQGADKAVPKLAERLDDGNGDVRHTAVTAIRHFGSQAESAVAALARAVGHKDPAMRVPAIQALLAIGTEAQPAVPALIQALADPEVEVRAAAAGALGQFGPNAKAAVEALKKARGDADKRVRQAANDALLLVK